MRFFYALKNFDKSHTIIKCISGHHHLEEKYAVQSICKYATINQVLLKDDYFIKTKNKHHAMTCERMK